MTSNYAHCLSVLTDFLKRTSKVPCALCHSSSPDGICEYCYERYLENLPSRCRCCGNTAAIHESPRNIPCAQCLKTPPSFDETIVACDYAPPLDQLVLSLKFQSRLALAPLIGKLIHRTIEKQQRPDGWQPDFIIAVPLGRARLIERGFNQSHEIARTLARLMGIPLRSDLIYRNRETDKQSTVPFVKRKNNVRNAFSVQDIPRPAFKGLHIGVVDDIMTTGHTLEEIARLLKKAGVERITNFIFPRTPSGLLQENRSVSRRTL